MMGKQSAPEELFYKFRLEDHVPPDHPLRLLDVVLTFDRVRTVLAGHYSHTGRPSIDPELMLRMLLIGYAYGIRSERQLCNEVHLNLAYRWFCPVGAGRRGAGSFDLFQEPLWPLPRERYLPHTV
jgi:transposase